MLLVSPATRELIKMGSNATCSEVRVGWYLSGTFPLQNDLHLQDASSFYAVIVCGVKRAEQSQEDLKFTVTFRPAAYTAGVSILRGTPVPCRRAEKLDWSLVRRFFEN